MKHLENTQIDHIFQLIRGERQIIEEEELKEFKPLAWSFLLMYHPEYDKYCDFSKLSCYQIQKIKNMQPKLITLERISHLNSEEQNSIKKFSDFASEEFNDKYHNEKLNPEENYQDIKAKVINFGQCLTQFLKNKHGRKFKYPITTSINPKELVDSFPSITESIFRSVQSSNIFTFVKDYMKFFEAIGYLKIEKNKPNSDIVVTIFSNDKHFCPKRRYQAYARKILTFFQDNKFNPKPFTLSFIQKKFKYYRIFIERYKYMNLINSFRLGMKIHFSYKLYGDLTFQHLGLIALVIGDKNIPYHGSVKDTTYTKKSCRGMSYACDLYNLGYFYKERGKYKITKYGQANFYKIMKCFQLPYDKEIEAKFLEEKGKNHV